MAAAQQPWGKMIGGFLGLWVAGPWGAVAGVLIGHMHDTRPPLPGASDTAGLWSNYGDFSANVEQATFTMGVVVLSAKMAKSDGRVTRAEIEAFKRVFNIRPDQEAAIGRLFDRARLSADGFEPYALQLAQVFRRKRAVLEEILSGLFIIGASDSGGLSPAELTFLKRVGFIFGFSNEDFLRIAARAGVRMPERERPRNPTVEAFAILGVVESAANDDIKTAYRALIREHHPDKLMAQGMPPEFVATATEKMKRINAAYDVVCRIKGIK
ncbi:MAG: TerB family tellurite resistance protein [Alphaproteobacteria bacterium]|nr:TerB family tellurite resistance protein [Alphaproteobacteria bacterium]